jgi:hypothetical protein
MGLRTKHQNMATADVHTDADEHRLLSTRAHRADCQMRQERSQTGDRVRYACRFERTMHAIANGRASRKRGVLEVADGAVEDDDVNSKEQELPAICKSLVQLLPKSCSCQTPLSAFPIQLFASVALL